MGKCFDNDISISILIPVYNVGIYLERCLLSLERQSWSSDEVEIICVDDGSTDNSLEICNRHAEKYDYIKVIHKENGGVSSARNVGLANATGKYLAWIDSDDYVSNDYWEQVRYVLDKDYDMCFFSHYKLYENQLIPCIYASESHSILKDNFIKQIHDGVKIASYLPTKITKRCLWEEVRFPENISLGEDSAVLPRIVIQANTFYYIKKPLYYYRKHSSSICHNISLKDIISAYEVVEARQSFFQKYNFDVDRFGIAYKAFVSLDEITSNERRYVEDILYEDTYNKFHQIVKKNRCVLTSNPEFSYKNKVKLFFILHDMFPMYKFVQFVYSKLKNVCLD